MRAEGTTKGRENAEGMALGCVRVDLTVRLGRVVECLDLTTEHAFSSGMAVARNLLNPGHAWRSIAPRLTNCDKPKQHVKVVCKRQLLSY